MSRNLAKSAVWVTFSEIFFNLSGFVIHSALGRFLGPEDYGRYGLIITLTTTVIILIGNGIPTAMAKYISEYFETDAKMVGVIKKQAVFAQTIIIGAITVIFYLSAPLISQILGDSTLTPLFQLSTLVIPAFAAGSFYFSYYTGLHKFNLQATLKTWRSVFRIIFVIALAFLFKVKGSIVGYILAPGSVFLIAYVIDRLRVSKELKEKSALQDKDYHPTFDWKKLVNYAWQIIIFFLAYELLISIDLYMVKGILHDDNLTGIYNGALTVGRIPYYIFYAMTIFLLPMVSKSTAAKDDAETKNIISQALRIMMILLVPMIILMAVFAKPILFLFYGKSFLLGAQPMAILEYGVGFLTIFYVLTFAVNGAGKTKVPMLISVVGVILNVILNYILIKKMSILGSATATSITSLVIMIMMLVYLYKVFGVAIKLKSFLKTALAGVVLYFVANLFSKGELIFMLWSVILFAFYLVFLYVLGEITKADLDYILALTKKKKKEEVEINLSGNEPSA